MDLSNRRCPSERPQLPCGLLAVLGVSLWSCPITFIWGLLYHVAPSLAVFMLPTSGALIALVVRLHGRGVCTLLQVLSFLCYGVLLLTSLMFGFAIATPVPVALVFALVAMGALGTWLLFHAQMTISNGKAWLTLGRLEQSSLGKTLRNHWFLVLPLGLVGGGLSSFGGVMLLATVGCFNVN
ncbi:hypothetical protein [Gallaecimonas mangrovi]|uniref:hypothetical protein n=1 Tax=Gallaecimonas mangrovi TaxID=2291597 RepID=UPI000E203B86|nr:hypothetical protein [Gallaecimonas mangrovi]